jgi:hypothetical protein
MRVASGLHGGEVGVSRRAVARLRIYEPFGM